MTHSRVHTDDRAADSTPGDGGAAGGILTRADLPATLAAALDAAIDKSAKNPTILRVTEIAGYTDWVLIVSARNERQVAAIADAVGVAAKAAGAKSLGIEGTGEHLWDLLDFDDFMVHVFFHPVRTHYDLESMWSDAPRVVLGLAPDVMDTSELEQLALPDGLPAYHGDATFGGFDDEFGDAPPPERTRPRLAHELSTRAGRLRPRREPAAAPDDSLAGGLALGHDDDFDADALGDDEFDDDLGDADDPADDDFDDAADDLGDADDPAAEPEPEPAPAKPGRDRS